MRHVNLAAAVCSALIVLAACAGSEKSSAPAGTSAKDAGGDGATALADTAAADTAAADIASADAGKADAAADAKNDAKTADVPKISCAGVAGGWAVTGTCSNGGTSIPFGCMMVKDCTLSWETDYRDWVGPLTGADYSLKGKAGDSIVGHFDGPDDATYTYQGGSLTCESSMTRFASSMTGQVCCHAVAQDCADAGQACVPIAEGDIVTTGCLDVAAGATATEGAACSDTDLPLTCGKGLICGRPIGSPKGTASHCKKLCVGSKDCGATQNCLIVSGSPKSGVCETSCVAFAATGTAGACPAGMACTVAAVADAAEDRVSGTLCVLQGSGAVGAACDSTSDCGADSLCLGSKCRSLCDKAHPCAAGSCTDFGLTPGPTAPQGFGYCK